MKRTASAYIMAAAVFLASGCSQKNEAETVNIGILHSRTGSMAISEQPLRDAEMLAVNELNEAGGVLGKRIVVIDEDGESDSHTFVEKAKKLITEDNAVSVFGCWTSASRKAVKPVFEEFYSLLWYPVQYEGMEASPNIIYTGAAPNQQVVPAVNYFVNKFGKRVFLIGSDYIFPRTANRIIKAELKDLECECVGEEYVILGRSDFEPLIKEILKQKPDVIFNTLNGDSNIAFFNQLKAAGISADMIPVMSFSIAEEEVSKIGIENICGHYVAWNYFQTTDTEANRDFIKKYRASYGESRVTSDPIVAAYSAVHLWAKAVEKAGCFDTEKVRIAAKGLSFDSPGGTVTIDGQNQHLYKTVRIGKINESGTIEEVWTSDEQIKPDPYLSAYAWAWGM